MSKSMTMDLGSVSRAISHRHNFSRDLTDQERKQATEDALLAASNAQREIISLSIVAQHPFERWAGKLLHRHFEHVLVGGQAKNAGEGSEQITQKRTADLYCGRSQSPTSRPSPREPLNERAVYLERLVFRYLAQLSAHQRSLAVDRICELVGLRDDFAQRIGSRLADGAAAEASERDVWLKAHPRDRSSDNIWEFSDNCWSIDAISLSLFGLLSWRYISTIADHVQKTDPLGYLLHKETEIVLERIGKVVEVNHPGQIVLARQHLSHAGIGPDLNDLISVAMDATRASAQRYHPLFGRGGFTAYTKMTIRSELRRAAIKSRTIAVPEEKILLVAKLNDWKARHLIEAESMSLAEQMSAAEITRVTPAEMAEIIRLTHETNALSITALSESSADSFDEAGNIADSIFTDGGRGAAAIRENADADPRVALMRPAFQSLSPLHQGLLACLHPCSITEGGEFAWFNDFQARSEKTIEAALKRFAKGVTNPNQVAGAIHAKY